MKHYVIYIHGITISPTGNSHKREYKEIHNTIEGISEDTVPIYTEWGHTCNQYEIGMFDSVNQRIKPEGFHIPVYDPILYDMKKMLIFGISDVFYYCAPNGEQAIRNAIFGNIAEAINEHIENIKKDGVFQFSIVAHSMGSIVGFDFLYNLFGKTRARKKSSKYNNKILDGILGSLTTGDNGNPGTFFDLGGVKIELRLRNFITMGSQILLTLGRNDKIKKNIEDSKLLNPADIGLIDPSSQRWMNIWDKQDFLGFPIVDVFDNSKKIIIEPKIETGIFFMEAHQNYFESKSVQKVIADYGYW